MRWFSLWCFFLVYKINRMCVCVRLFILRFVLYWMRANWTFFEIQMCIQHICIYFEIRIVLGQINLVRIETVICNKQTTSTSISFRFLFLFFHWLMFSKHLVSLEINRSLFASQAQEQPLSLSLFRLDSTTRLCIIRSVFLIQWSMNAH